MIPINTLATQDASDTVKTSKTYKLSTDKIQGFVDELDALQQTIYKMLSTEKYEHSIYSFSYGIQLEDLIGKDAVYVKAELKRRITEYLIQDDRISSIDNFIFIITGDEMLCTFDVVSIYGSITITKEVNT